MPDPQTATLLRLGVFLGVLLGLLVLERHGPWRGHAAERHRRWPANLGLGALGSLLVALLPGAGAVGAAAYAQALGWGLLPALGLSGAGLWLASLLLLDLLIYVQHRAFHRLPVLWRLHRVHHSDLALDATSGLRFHPGEILLSLGLKAAAALALGAPPLAVLVYEALLNAMALFTHADLQLPRGLERALRRVLVTPDLHRIHHGVDRDETDSNYASVLSCWDRGLGSYRAASREDPATRPLGLPELRDPAALDLPLLLRLPLR